nr:putative 2-dehydropantoate 2-reductase [Quercus suber]
MLDHSSVGSIFGSRAQGKHARVTAVCRSNYDIARSKGIEIRSQLWGSSIYRPDRVIRSPSEVSHVAYDYVVVATKLTEESADSMGRSLSLVVKDQTTLVSAQNGVTSELALRKCGFDNPILSTTCYISCRQPRAGVVEQISHVRPHAFYIGKHSSGRRNNGDLALDTLVSLDDSFAKVEDAQTQRWEKMVFNAAWNPTSALFGKDTHGLLQDAAEMQTVRALAAEAVAVGQAMGIPLSDELVATTVNGPSRAPPIEPSMLQDLKCNRPLELEALCAGIIKFGRQTGIPTPIMEATYNSLSMINLRRFGKAPALEPASFGVEMADGVKLADGVEAAVH